MGAFERYAKTGAQANAYTSFDRTCYLFGCSSRAEENLDILLDFVSHPYFTQETVEKEQGIIGQEIRMYDDEPGWRVEFNLSLIHISCISACATAARYLISPPPLKRAGITPCPFSPR